jgi:hypothetical protein
MPSVMRLMVAVVVLLMGSSRSISGNISGSVSLQHSRVMRDHTDRSGKRERPLHRQEAAEQNNNQISRAETHTRDGNTDAYQAQGTVIHSISGNHST